MLLVEGAVLSVFVAGFALLGLAVSASRRR
jgi:MYXO-CTERM domain-containing protein